MSIRKFKPTSPALRQMTVSSFDEITKTEPEKSLVVSLNKSGGRNSQGRITIRHRGGGAKRKYRIIDFKRDKDGIPGRVAAVEYDPNRTSNIALINYVDGEKKYIIAPHNLKVGDMIESGEMTGNLDNVMERLAVQYEKDAKIDARIKGAMIYPMVLSILSILTVHCILLQGRITLR